MMRVGRNQRGFTLLELLALIVVGFGLLGLSFSLLHTTDYSHEELTNKRRLQLALLAQATSRYERETGKPLQNLPEKPVAISSVEGGYDLCKILVPTYISDLPYDPQIGTKLLQKRVNGVEPPCGVEGVAYATGYLISRDKQGHVMLKSAIPEESLSIIL